MVEWTMPTFHTKCLFILYNIPMNSWGGKGTVYDSHFVWFCFCFCSFLKQTWVSSWPTFTPMFSIISFQCPFWVSSPFSHQFYMTVFFNTPRHALARACLVLCLIGGCWAREGGGLRKCAVLGHAPRLLWQFLPAS